jgi:hypothetical protein
MGRTPTAIRFRNLSNRRTFADDVSNMRELADQLAGGTSHCLRRAWVPGKCVASRTPTFVGLSGGTRYANLWCEPRRATTDERGTHRGKPPRGDSSAGRGLRGANSTEADPSAYHGALQREQRDLLPYFNEADAESTRSARIQIDLTSRCPWQRRATFIRRAGHRGNLSGGPQAGGAQRRQPEWAT